MTDAAPLLPGEAGPLPMRHGGAPITDAEALGVARRLARTARRPVTSLDATELTELPPVAAPAIQAAFRLSPRLLMFVRAKAEMENTTVTRIIEDALEGYAGSSPGAVQRWEAPAGGVGVRRVREPRAPRGLVSAREAADLFGVPLHRVQAWARRSRELGRELQAPREAWVNARTPLYDLRALRSWARTSERAAARRGERFADAIDEGGQIDGAVVVRPEHQEPHTP